METEKKLADSLGVPYEIKQVEIGNHRINYLVAGSGHPVLLIHGGNIGWGQWYPNIPELSRHFKVYAIDLPGAGRSSRVNYRTLNVEEDFFAVVKTFISEKIKSNTHVIGSSIGGWIALKLAIEHHAIDRAVVTDSIGFTSHLGLSDRILSIYPLALLVSRTILKPHRNNKNIEKFLRSILHDKDLPLSNAFIDYFYETMQSSHNLLFLSSLSNISGMRKNFILVDQLHQISNSVLIVWGENDHNLPLKFSQPNFPRIKNVRVYIVQNSHHMPFLEQAVECNNKVLEFLK
jgi:pimeloyl-ACP methyl ester carboxylesterase